MRFAAAVLLGLCGQAGLAAAQAPFRRVATVDSAMVIFAQTSPDEKWVVFNTREGYASSSLWLAPTAGGPPIQLTSDGYNDRRPVWFQSGDRIAFLSTRPNRNGGRQLYAMTLAIDPATGRPVGGPQQVTTEPVGREGPPSPDGRWLAYVSAGAVPELKVVPVNGGMARTVTRVAQTIGGFVFDPRGTHLYYTEATGSPGAVCTATRCGTYTLRRAPVNGGEAETIAREDHLVRVLPADPRYILHHLDGPGGTGKLLELRDRSGRLIGRTEMSREMSWSATTADGFGVVATVGERDRSVRVATVAGGPVRKLTVDGGFWPEGWAADGRAVIADRREAGRMVVEMIPLGNGERSRRVLPEGVVSSGWRTSTGPWFSFTTGMPDTALHAINVLTGETRLVAPNVYMRGRILGRGGEQQDGSRWIYSSRSNGQFEFRSTDPATGDTRVIRRLPDDGRRQRQFMVHGSRMAWFEVRGDSTDLRLSDGPDAPIRRLATYWTGAIGDDEDAAISWQGDRIAVCGKRSRHDSTNVLSVLTIPASAVSPVAHQEYELGTASGCWAPKWLPDDSGLVLLVIVDRRDDVPDLAHLPLQSGARPTVFTGDEPGEIWEYTLSPDGRLATYGVILPVSRSTIHVASFRSLIGR